MIAAGVLLTVATAVAPLPHSRSGHGPALVLVHGLGGDRHVWDDVARRLEKSFTVIAVDLPEHGEAPAPASYDADRIAAQLVATAQAEHVSRAIFVGHSLGGFIVAHLADARMVAGVVVVDIGIAGLFGGDEVEQLRAMLAKDREGTLRGWFGAISKPAQLERLLTGVRKLSNEAILGWAAMLAKQSTPGEKLPRPALLMASKLVLPDDKSRAEALAAAGFAKATQLGVERFEQSMHWLFWDEPDKFVATLTRFAQASAR